MPGTALAIMTRCPEKGKIKTRLAKSIGEEEALQLYQAFLVDLASEFACGTQTLYWTYTPTETDFAALLSSILPIGLALGQYIPQQGADFTDRLYHIFLTLLQSYQRVVVIASDSPHIKQQTIDRAEAALEVADIVLGPSDDGGYYLIGMGEPHDLFHGIPMSTSRALQVTIEKARSQKLTIHLLEPLFDVDELSDLQRLAQLLRENPLLAPATAACIAHSMKEFVW